MEAIQITDDLYADHLRETTGGIVLFHKKLCPHCKNMAKVLEKLNAKRPEIRILHIDSEENPKAMAALGVERVPTLFIIKNGDVTAKHVGLLNPKETISLFDRSGV